MTERKFLTFWEEDCNIEDFKQWCGSPDAGFKSFERNYIKQKNYKSVLDIGAGVYSEYHGFKKDKIDIDYTATEITEKFISLGKDQEINVVRAYSQDLPFEDNTFDAVLCYDILEHQLDFKESILEMYRVCKSDVIISFFKSFTEEARCREEVYKNLVYDNFKVEKSKETEGVIVHRLINSDGNTSAVYHFYCYSEILNFLEDNNMAFDFYEVAEDWATNPQDRKNISRRMLKIHKRD